MLMEVRHISFTLWAIPDFAKLLKFIKVSALAFSETQFRIWGSVRLLSANLVVFHRYTSQ